MNESGKSIAALSHFYKIDAKNIIVISDDISLDVGRIRVRSKGSAGGHNGLKSIIASLGTDEFPRVKIGVGEKPSNTDIVAHVLGKFSQVDERVMKDMYIEAMEACIDIIEYGIEAAMNRHNAKNRL